MILSENDYALVKRAIEIDMQHGNHVIVGVLQAHSVPDLLDTIEVLRGEIKELKRELKDSFEREAEDDGR